MESGIGCDRIDDNIVELRVIEFFSGSLFDGILPLAE
jgi:hypothetical protein